MDTIRQLFVSYSRLDDETPVFRLVEDLETLDVIKNGAPLFKRVGSFVYVDSVRETDPIITIACVTERALQPHEPENIAREVVNWLRENGEMWA